jgi:Ni,Fe-hydrogenase I large subunit
LEHRDVPIDRDEISRRLPLLEALVDLIPDQPPTRPQAPVTPEPIQDRQVEVEREIAVRQQISTFFADPDLEAYSEFYGPAKGADGSAVSTWEHLTPGQRANRLSMLERAQLILDGAEATGLKLSTTEAMERAHLEVSAPIAQQIVREKIKASVVKRAKGVTIKPSAGKTPPPKAGKYDEKQHIADVAAELKSVFGS